MELVRVMYFIALVFEIAGVAVIVGGFVLAVFTAVSPARRSGSSAYDAMRRIFGKSLLLGLEVLVAADLIRTISVAPTIENLLAFGLLVFIRSFLSWSLDLELEGVWPWSRRRLQDEEAWHVGRAEQP